jgi:hypothetical protein
MQDLQPCIDACTDCSAICWQTAAHCLEKGGEHAQAQHIRLLLDCAAICRTSAEFMLRGSDLHDQTCAVCAEICDRCAESCEAMADRDQQMMACAEACRRCAEMCRRMAGETRVTLPSYSGRRLVDDSPQDASSGGA